MLSNCSENELRFDFQFIKASEFPIYIENEEKKADLNSETIYYNFNNCTLLPNAIVKKNSLTLFPTLL